MRGNVTVNCEECGAAIRKWASQLAGRKFGAFCNKDCLGKFRSRKLVGEWAANYRIGSRRSRQYIEAEAKWNPGANSRGYVSLHRLIAEAHAGRFLRPDEIVHHRDGDPRNNHWSNLEIMTQADHAKEHNALKERDQYGRFQDTKGNRTPAA